MKIEPLSLILGKNHDYKEQFYFISGNETTLMNKTKDHIVEKILQNDLYQVEKIKNINLKKKEESLFNKNSVYIVNDITGIDKKVVDGLCRNDDKYIFLSENSPKNKLIKNIFNKRPDSLLLECYELSRSSKEKVIRDFLFSINLKLEDSLYWGLVDRLDNKYMFLENELKKIQEIKNITLSESLLNELISKETYGGERVFFDILKSNKHIVNVYNKKITNSGEISNLFYYIKQFSNLILNSENISDFEKNIPKYLFRERVFLIELFNKFNQNKKRELLKLLYNTERAMRTSGNLSLSLGLRFLLKFKKISIS